MKFRQVFYIAASLALVGLIWTLAMTLLSMRSIQNNDVVNVSNMNGGKVKTQIGDFSQIRGTEVLKAALYLKQEYQSSYGSKETSSIQNYIFFDLAKKGTYWLMPKNEGLILSAIALSENENSRLEPNTNIPSAFMYLIADKDTNNDKRINWEDRKLIAISDPSGLRYKVLIDLVDNYNGSSIVKNNRVSLLYQSANKLKIAEVDLRSQEIISNSEFSNQP